MALKPRKHAKKIVQEERTNEKAPQENQEEQVHTRTLKATLVMLIPYVDHNLWDTKKFPQFKLVE